jgi:arylsulfatase A-like enzyme
VLLTAAVAAACLVFHPSCQRTGRPNIILVVIDSLRADRLSSYGNRHNTSPNIDAVAGDGVLFSNVLAESPWTLPSHASIFTSLYVSGHGVRRDAGRLHTKAVTLAERLHDAGYVTGAFVCGPFVKKRYGFNQGFETYDESLAARSHVGSHRAVTSEPLTRMAKEWLAARGTEPFFLFLHYWDVHYDYIPPKPFDTIFDPGYRGTLDGRDISERGDLTPDLPREDLEHLFALYDGEIAYTDHHLGDLFSFMKKAGLWESTVLVITSDHGDELLDHGQTGHSHTVHEELIRVPLIIRDPGLRRRGFDVDELVELVDLYPTFLEMAGAEPPPHEMEGVSLVPLLEGRDVPWDDVGYAETFRGNLDRVGLPTDWAVHRSIQLGRLKLIQRLREPEQLLLFDLDADPRELREIAAERPEEVRALKERLDAWAEAQGRKAWELRLSGKRRLDEETLEQLRSLGYVE